jgi:glutamate-1-semialdehyde 2,1-aminomutase
MDRIGLPEYLEGLGTYLRQGMANLAQRHGVGLRQSGPVAMPLWLFDDDADFAKGGAFCRVALDHGAYLHPKHNMFLNAAHTRADMDAVLAAAEAGFAALV